MRPCHCDRDRGGDKHQDSRKKDHPGTMGRMGTISALLETVLMGVMLQLYSLFEK